MQLFFFAENLELTLSLKKDIISIGLCKSLKSFIIKDSNLINSVFNT